MRGSLGNRAVCLILLIAACGSSVSLKLPSQAQWHENGTTVAGSPNGTNGTALGQLQRPIGLSVADNNVLYIADLGNHRIVVVHPNSTTDILSIDSALVKFDTPHDLTILNASLYVLDCGNQRVVRMSLDGSDPAIVVNSSWVAYALYFHVHVNGHIYLSMPSIHQVWRFDPTLPSGTRVAGTGVNGSSVEEFNLPYGLFVTDDDKLYVADCYNHRIMQWKPGAKNGTQVVGSGTPGSGAGQISAPTDVVVDADGNLYISEAGNERITRWDLSTGFGMCIAACTGKHGTAPSQLYGPHGLAFDRKGSLYVTDYINHRVQRFQRLNAPIPYNQPNISQNATWDRCATTVVQYKNKPETRAFFVDWNDTIYTADYEREKIEVWSSNGSGLVRRLAASLHKYTCLFVTINGDVYFENEKPEGQIDKWPQNSTEVVSVIRMPGRCAGLHVDIFNNFYCSVRSKHRVFKHSLDSDDPKPSTIAGTKEKGSGTSQLSHPWGIFVDIDFTLYVADSYNARIQRFRSDSIVGETVAGQGVPDGLQLKMPTDVVVDSNGHVYIADNNNHRVIRVSDNRFQCIAGCDKRKGKDSHELHRAYSVRLDRVGNLYVTDEKNRRIQKFQLGNDSCEKPPSPYFVARPCENASVIGVHCNISATTCDALKPCLNDGTCANIDHPPGYHCTCPPDFAGTQCQLDRQLCKPDTCFNHGTCHGTSECICDSGWEGRRCERKINFCLNVQCHNGGVCRPLVGDYLCECLAGSFFGRHCEITATRVVVVRTVAKSMAYVAIIALVIVALFVIVMDVVKYAFGVDVTREERERMRREKRQWQQQRYVRRFVLADILPLSTAARAADQRRRRRWSGSRF